LVNRILFILNYTVRKIAVQLGYYSKPDFLIVGAQKSGTSALFGILKQHSKITGAIRKEIHFFDNEKNFNPVNYKKYHVLFPLPNKVPKGNLIFEATPSYIYNPKAAERIFKYNPDLKIIICLRNPVARALSGWTMFHYGFKGHKRYGRSYDPSDYSSAIEKELKALTSGVWHSVKPPYIQTGIYYYQIENYYRFFPKQNVLILEHDELKHHHDVTVKTICDFLKISYEPLLQLEVNKSVKKNSEDYSKEAKLLQEFYKPYNEKLFTLIGKRYNW